MTTRIGKPCITCNSAIRYVRDGACWICARARRASDKGRDSARRTRQARARDAAAYKQRYRASHRDAHNAANRALYARNANTLARREERAKGKAARLATREADRQARKEARELERERERPVYAERKVMHNRVKRARRRKHYREGDLTAAQAQALLARQFYRCAYCGNAGTLHLDHKQPLRLGGAHTLANVQWLCARHNMHKRITPDVEYRRKMSIPILTPWMGYGLILI